LNITYVGNFIDFLEFGLFTALLPFLSQDLLSHYDPHLRAELCYLAVFAGFLGRPVGAFFLGKLGDVYGSQCLLVFSVLGISAASVLLALLPSNSAYIIEMIIICRFLQGLFTGAEYSAVVVSATQTSTVRHSYHSVALMTASGVLGISAAQLIAFLLALSHMEAMSWRYAFILVSFIGFGVFLKRAFSYRDSWEAPPPRESVNIKMYLPEILACVILVGMINSMFYLVNTFINNYKMIINLNLVASQFLLNFIMTAFFPLSIWLWSIYLTRRNYQPFKVLKYSLLSMLLVLPFLFYAYVQALPLWVNIIVQVVFSSCIQLFAIIGISLIPRLFPEAIRVQACGIGFNLGISLLGGGFPYLCLKLTESTNNLYTPGLAAVGTIILAYISLIVLIIRHPNLKDRKNLNFDAANDKMMEKILQYGYKK
jgi:MHS family proline/betaine transporter-like MFS transporter